MNPQRPLGRLPPVFLSHFSPANLPANGLRSSASETSRPPRLRHVTALWEEILDVATGRGGWGVGGGRDMWISPRSLEVCVRSREGRKRDPV